MPDRMLRDELLTSERYWSVSIEAREFFVHLILNVDDTARFSGKNYTLRTACYPGQAINPDRIESMLAELVDKDLVRLYHVDGERFVFLPRFRQRLRFTKSRYPQPPKEINDIPEEKTDSSQAQDGPKTDSSQTQDGRREEKRSEEKRREEAHQLRDEPIASDADASSPPGRAEPSLAKQKNHPPMSTTSPVGGRARERKKLNGHDAKKLGGLTNAVWQAYSTAYLDRYLVEPVRNAKVNGMLAKLVERVGAEQAPAVAQWYVLHQHRMDYVRSRHCVDLLLRDAEGLHTEWQRGEAVTATSARMTDESATRIGVFQKLINEQNGG